MSSIYDNYPAIRYVDEYDKDTDKDCVRCKGNCGFIGITGQWACRGFVPMTNADRIRHMTDEELAWYIANQRGWYCDFKDPSEEEYPKVLEWLKSPADKEVET